MTLLISKNELFHDRLSYYLLCLLLIFLPFGRFYSEVALAGFLIHTIIHVRKLHWKKININALYLPSFYFLTIIATFYSVDKKAGINLWSHQSALLLFPILLTITSLNIVKYKFQLLAIFSITCTAAILYLLIYHFVHIFTTNGLPQAIFSSEFMNHNFSAPIALHATYLSLYVALSLSSCIYFFFNQPGIPRILYGMMIGVLSAGLLLLSSRAVLISTIIIVILLIPMFLLERKKRWYFAGGILAIVLSGLLLLMQFNDFKERNITALQEDLKITNSEDNKVETRLERWSCAIELIKESPVFGYGNGSEIKKLKEKYFARKYYLSYTIELNAHNQYLSILISLGVVGLILFLYILYKGFAFALLNKDFIFMSFLVLVAVTSVSENILSVNKGIFFFSFFFPFFMATGSTKDGA